MINNEYKLNMKEEKMNKINEKIEKKIRRYNVYLYYFQLIKERIELKKEFENMYIINKIQNFKHSYRKTRIFLL